MNVTYRIAQLNDLDVIYAFAEAALKVVVPNDTERMMKIWESRFRKEALEHYLKLGWSFIAEDENQKLYGYFLGQPLLFFEGHTQTLWVEDVQAENLTIKAELVDITYKLARDKHFQKVILPMTTQNELEQKNIKFQKTADSTLWCKTTK